MLLMSSADFLSNVLFLKFLSVILSECPTVWTQNSPGIFFSILGRGPRAFQIEKSNKVNP